jgi:hypothetical protein
MLRYKLYIFTALCAVVLLVIGCGGGGSAIPSPIPDRVLIKLNDPFFSGFWNETIVQRAYDDGSKIMSFTLPLPVFYDGYRVLVTKDTEGNIVRKHELSFPFDDTSQPFPRLMLWDYDGYYQSDTIEENVPTISFGEFLVEMGKYDDPVAETKWVKYGTLNLKHLYKNSQLQRGKVYEVRLEFYPFDVDLIDLIYHVSDITPKSK